EERVAVPEGRYDIDRVIGEWKPGRIIIGLPLAADGSETAMSRAARSFAADLQARHGEIPVAFQDERYSSRLAGSHFAQARRDGHARRRDARNLDSVAAAIIVESWLAEHRPGEPA
ncbi:MAG: Holliday junction resolvase RuvX, partial [Wenzhouxiangellaceae bacterium]